MEKDMKFTTAGEWVDSQFVLDPNSSLAVNFHQWYDMDTAERDSYGEQPLDRLVAISEFAKLFKVAAVAVQDSIDQEQKKFDLNPQNA